eukprot:UN04889
MLVSIEPTEDMLRLADLYHNCTADARSFNLTLHASIWSLPHDVDSNRHSTIWSRLQHIFNPTDGTPRLYMPVELIAYWPVGTATMYTVWVHPPTDFLDSSVALAIPNSNSTFVQQFSHIQNRLVN